MRVSSSGTERARGAHVLTWLRDQGKLSTAQAQDVLQHAVRTGERVEEALIDVGLFDEASLLKLLAAMYGTRFVSTERLAKADIHPRILDNFPHKIAERLCALPIVFERKTQTLSLVMAAPGEDDAEKQILVVTGVREVRLYVARPAAIRAGIAKFYGGKTHAFAELLRSPHYAAIDPGFQTGAGHEFEDPFASLVMSTSTRAVTPIPTPPLLEAVRVPVPNVPLANEEPATEVRIAADAYLETLNVLVSLLEQDRGELRGHSGQVAHVCRLVAQRAGLNAHDTHALVVAAYLHDVGKITDGFHLTALNVARHDGHRTRAHKGRTNPTKLFASAALPDATSKILAHLYERFDGQGFPDRLSGKDIPYGARVLALVETYCDLIGNSRNPYRRVLSPPQALSVLKDLSGTLFDPTLAELLRHVVQGPRASDALAGLPRALLVDPSAEETLVLEMRLIEHGFAVKVARDLASARDALKEGPTDLVITELDLGAGGGGFELLQALREIPEDDRPAAILLATKADRESVSRGFELGAADYLVKPASPELVATKAGQLLEGAMRQRASGVSGSLRQMSLPDVVQILANGRRGGKLSLVSGAKRGEIHFADGQIHDARFGNLAGEEAFYAMLKLTDGTFALDPSFAPSQRAIHASAEGLLLEGMRRLDEGIG